MMATTAYAQLASAFAQQAPTGPSPPQSYLYRSPISQTPSSTNVSPTNYHSHLHVRQVHRPKQPLYIPAALRPTDITARPADIPRRSRAPPTPPRSAENSFDSKQTSSSAILEAAGVPDGGVLNEEFTPHRIGLTRAESEGLESEAPADVTGEPTRAHWKPDHVRSYCAICARLFTMFFRRHHCRRCGDIVCADHLSKTVPLDQNARLHYYAQKHRACDNCFNAYTQWKALRHSRANSIAESNVSSQDTAVPSHPGLQIPKQALPGLSEEMRVGSMARSAGGMEWSTF